MSAAGRRPGLPPAWAAIARKATVNRAKSFGAPSRSKDKANSLFGARASGVTVFTFWCGVAIAAVLSTSATLLVLRTVSLRGTKAPSVSFVADPQDPPPEEPAVSPSASELDGENSESEPGSPSPVGDDAPKKDKTGTADEAAPTNSMVAPAATAVASGANDSATAPRAGADLAAKAMAARARVGELFRKITGAKPTPPSASPPDGSSASPTQKAEGGPKTEPASPVSQDASDDSVDRTASSRPKRSSRAGHKRTAAKASGQASETGRRARTVDAPQPQQEEQEEDADTEKPTGAAAADSSGQGQEWLDPFEIR